MAFLSQLGKLAIRASSVLVGIVVSKTAEDIIGNVNDKRGNTTELHNNNANSIVRILSRVALADGLLSEKELEILISGLPKGNNLNRAAIEDIIKKESNDPSDLKQLFKQIVTRKAAEDIVLLSAKIAFADNDCSPEELVVIKEIAEALKITPQKLQEYIEIANKPPVKEEPNWIQRNIKNLIKAN